MYLTCFPVKISFTTTDAKISGAGLSNDYNLAELHFHWGENDQSGSEHQIDGKKFPLEVKFILSVHLCLNE